MNHKTRARLFVESFLSDLGAEASVEFKDDLENAIEDLLDDVADEATDEAESKTGVLVWKKREKPTAAVVADTWPVPLHVVADG